MAMAAVHSRCKMTTDMSDRASNPDKGLIIVKLVTNRQQRVQEYGGRERVTIIIWRRDGREVRV